MIVLRNYLEVDASQKAIGMALMQSVQEHESEAIDGQHQNHVEVSVNDWEKPLFPMIYCQ